MTGYNETRVKRFSSVKQTLNAGFEQETEETLDHTHHRLGTRNRSNQLSGFITSLRTS